MLLPSLLLAQTPNPAPTPPPPTGVIDFAADGGTWAWLQHDKGAVALFSGGPGREPQRIAEGAGWTELAVAGADCWILNRSAGTLLRVPLQPGAAPAAVVSTLRSPGGLHAASGTLYWLEAASPGAAGLPFVPTTGATLHLKARVASGQVRTLGQWPIATGPAGQPQRGDVLGTDAEEVYFRARRTVSTEFVRCPLTGGDARRVAIEPGAQDGLFLGGQLFWTAPSEEAALEAFIVQVRRLSGGRVETVADWLPNEGTLLARGPAPWYVSYHLYRLPMKQAPAPIHGVLPVLHVESDGSQVVLLEGPGSPRVFAGKKE